eukprot:4572496-Prymnesium_polylepis.1
MHSRYFDKLESRCHDCGDIKAKTAAISGAVLLLFVGGFGIKIAVTRMKTSRVCSAIRRGAGRAGAIWHAAGMRFKGKAL